MSLRKTHIGFDATQKERGRLSSNYQGVKSLLEMAGYTCEEVLEFPLTLPVLQKYSIIIFACPDSCRFQEMEINALLEYVSFGGNLFLLSHAGGDQGRRTNLGSLTEVCGIKFNNDEVLDRVLNLGYAAYPVVQRLESHPITMEIDNFCYRIGCSLTVDPGINVLAFTEETAQPANEAVLALANYGLGCILVSGSYEMFQDEVKGGIQYPNNSRLFQNIVQWLESPSKPIGKLKRDSTAQQKLSKFSVGLEKEEKQILIPNDVLAPSNGSESDNEVKDPEIVLPNLSEQKPHALPKSIMKLPVEFSKLKANFAKLEEQHQTSLKETIEIQEKLRIFELNLADFPSQTLAELPIEVEANTKRLKAQEVLISQVQNQIITINKSIENIQGNLELILEKIEQKSELSESKFPSVITTAADLFNSKGLSPQNFQTKAQISPKVSALQQMLALLEQSFKSGGISSEEYERKRSKYKRALSQVAQS